MRIKIFTICLLISYSVNAQEINPGKFSHKEITLADIADDIQYLPIDNSITIGSILSYKILQKSIYICSRETGVIRYDRNCKNTVKIGTYGRGPGEYSTCWSFAVDEQNGIVYVLDWGKIFVFSENGQLIRSMPIPECDQGNCFTMIDFISNKLLLAQFISMGNARYDWIIKEPNGNTIREKRNSIKPFISSDAASGGIYSYGSNLGYWNYYNDTVFSIQPDLTYKASYIFSPGNHRLPRQGIISSSSNDYFTKLNSYFTPQRIFETSRLIWLTFRYEQKRSIGIIDKESKESFLIYLGKDNSGGILNNIDGGLPFQPYSSFEENGREYLIGFVDAFKLKSYISGDGFKNSKPLYPEKQLILKNLSDKLKETDNPIFCIVRLKK